MFLCSILDLNRSFVKPSQKKFRCFYEISKTWDLHVSVILLQSVNGSYIFTANILAKSAPQHTTLFLQSFSLGVSKTSFKKAKTSCNWKLNIKQVEQKIDASVPGQSYKYKEHTQERCIYLIVFFVKVKKKQNEKLFQQKENDRQWLLQKVALC